MEAVGKQEEKRQADGPKNGRLKAWLIFGLFVLILGAGAGAYLHFTAGHETTDDAQIDGHIHPVSPRVTGTVVKLLVKDNQRVKAGDVLLVIDPQPYQVAVQRAKADLAEAEATRHANHTEVPIVTTTSSNQLSSAMAGVEEAKAGLVSAEKQVGAAEAKRVTAAALVREAKAHADKAARDLERFRSLVEKEEISRQQFDAAMAAAAASKAQWEAAKAQEREAEEGVRVARSALEQQGARVARAEADARAAGSAPQQVAASRARAESAAARVLQMKAALEGAELDLGHTVVRAPVDGVISQRNVELGQVAQAGQPLLAVVDLDNVWVTANYKENQLENMRPGQKAVVSVDAYGGRTYRGHVDSIAAGTGAKFSLLPPENATGNYVKVVQRIPVKILIEKGQDAEQVLRPGMSVEPTVYTK
ncbi:MAG: putative multidrug resistance protein EmrK [Bryobacteraceae bacterium]|nr:putative multidrug resistance protein EmrK [Bryobacteraceae bacterium]